MTARVLLPIASAFALGAPLLAQNDECAGAIPVTVGSTSFDTTSATASAGAYLCESNTGADLWYSFTAPTDDAYRFDLCGASFDTVIEVHEGSCGASVVLGCSDDHCSLQSWTTVVCTAGMQYLVRAGGWGGASGLGDLNISVATRPVALAARYRLDEPAGQLTAVDDSGNGQNGTYANVVQGGAGAASSTGSSAAFDGSSSYVEIVGGPALDALQNDFSATAWFRIPSLPLGFSVNRIFGNGGPAGSWSFGIDGGSRLVFTSHTVRDYQQAVTIVPGQWHHVALSMDHDSDVTFYFDGAEVGTLPEVEQAEQADLLWYIGSWNPNFSIPQYFNGEIDDVQIYAGQLDAMQVADLFANPGSIIGTVDLGTNYCTAAQNQAGLLGSIAAFGSISVFTNDVTLVASDLPANQFGIFTVSATQGFVQNPGGSNGNLCLGGQIGRYGDANQIRSTGANGTFDLAIDLTRIPIGSVPVAATPGDTFNFQAWHREGVGGGSNFTDALEITFQ